MKNLHSNSMANLPASQGLITKGQELHIYIVYYIYIINYYYIYIILYIYYIYIIYNVI
jgi:hypothetical protein